MFKEIGQYKGFQFVNIESKEVDIPKDLKKNEVEVTD